MMPHAPVSKSEFKARALEYFQLVETSGESLIVADHGQPALEIRPYRLPESRPLNLLRGSVLRYANPADPIAEDDREASR
jgi:antitoxin (DNA-binding transcriptional repressor) of toxin-antitoxin stability system